MDILVTGATGFIGSHLTRYLSDKGYTVYGLSHLGGEKTEFVRKFYTLAQLKQSNHHFQVVVNLAGANIAAGRWTRKRKKALYDSRVTLTHALHAHLASPPKVLVSMSAVGFYGTHSSVVFDEYSDGRAGFTHDLCATWEDSAMSFEQDGSRVCVLRSGVVLGKGGALQKMKPAFLFGLGGPIATGEQWFPWIQVDDLVRLIDFAIHQKKMKGAFNAVAPQLVTQKTFAKAFAQALHRPAWCTTPAWALKGLFGEMSTLLTEGQKVIPRRTLEAGFTFQYGNLDAALQHSLC